MRITLVTGGARSGKSSYAQRLAAELGGDSVTVIATATPSDDEMADRIARHRDARPHTWRVIETATTVGRALGDATTDVVVLDCVTMLAANAVEAAAARDADAVSDAVLAAVRAMLDAARARGGSLIAVTNEVGSSIHPPTNLGRWFQDALGRANQVIAREADDVRLLVCGIPISVKETPG